MGLPTVTIRTPQLDGASLVTAAALTLGIATSDPDWLERLGAAFDDEPHGVIIDDVVAGLAGAIEQLLMCSDGVRIVVTSHVPLGLAGEQVVRVQGLELPAVGAPARDVSRSAAVLLFCSRAQAADPTFVINRSNANDIAEVCRVLNGLPLDIELAASRIRFMPPHVLLRELTCGAGLDTLGDARRRSLDKTCRLLSNLAWTVLRSFGVVVGNPRIDTVDAMTPVPRADVIAGLSELIDAELVRSVPDDDVVRLHCSLIVREYVRVRLDELAELETLRDRHAVHFCRLAGELAAQLFGPLRTQVLARLELELPELQVAFERFVQRQDRVRSTQLAVALGPVAFHRNDQQLARRIVSVLAPCVLEADEIESICWAVGVLGDQCPDRLDERIARTAGMALAMIPGADRRRDLRLIAVVCETLGSRDDALMASAARLGRDIAADLHDDWAWTRFTIWLAEATLHLDEPNLAMELAQAGYIASCALNDRFLQLRASLALHNLPASARTSDPTLVPLNQVAALAFELGDSTALIGSHLAIANRSLDVGDLAGVHRAAIVVLDLVGSTSRTCSAMAVGQLAQALSADGDFEAAALLHGAILRYERQLSRAAPPFRVSGYAALICRAAEHLGHAEFDRAVQDGTTMAWSDAIAYARRRAAVSSRSAMLPEARFDEPQPYLTQREIEVVRLMSDGWTNKQIATRLAISPKTIMHHTASIYRKLNVHGRAGAVSAWLRGNAASAS